MLYFRTFFWRVERCCSVLTVPSFVNHESYPRGTKALVTSHISLSHIYTHTDAGGGGGRTVVGEYRSADAAKRAARRSAMSQTPVVCRPPKQRHQLQVRTRRPSAYRVPRRSPCFCGSWPRRQVPSVIVHSSATSWWPALPNAESRPVHC